MADCERIPGETTETCENPYCKMLTYLRYIEGQSPMCHQVAFEGATGRRIMPQTDQQQPVQTDKQDQ